jgi:hypothetical protein
MELKDITVIRFEMRMNRRILFVYLGVATEIWQDFSDSSIDVK